MSRVFFKKDFKVFTQKSESDSKSQTKPKTVQPKTVNQKVIHKQVPIQNLLGISSYTPQDPIQQVQTSPPKKMTLKSISDYKPKNSLPVIEEVVIKQPQQKEKENSEQHNKKNDQSQKETKIKAPRKKKQAKQGKQKSKKIKKASKEGNLIKLDLKRKYEEKFVGGLRMNLRKFNRNGTLKEKYKNNSKINSQLQINGQGIYNSFVHSLSSALTVTLNLDENVHHKQQPLIDCKSYERSKQGLKDLIQQMFGYTDFRFGQYQVIKNILDYKSTLFISETGSGKSLTYILGSLLCEGMAVVISPLISLMLDQVQKLPKQLPGVCIHSHLSKSEKQRIIQMIQAGKVKLVYMTPEALQTDLAYKMRSFPAVSFVCIDQAHCISQLSHNFRTSYLSIHELIKCNFKFQKEYCVLGLTASANQETAESIMKKLDIKQYIRSSTLQRSNLVLTVSKDSGQNKYACILKYLKSQPIRKLRGILIYCRTYVKVKQVNNYLKNSGIKCGMFFAMLSQKQKTDIIRKFREGQIKVITTTIALGMGLDFAQLDSVIHLCMPSSVENYVQEIGRAGRRGLTAYCHMFLDPEDYLRERGQILSEKNDESDLQMLFDSIKKSTFDKMRCQLPSLKQLLEDSDSDKQVFQDDSEYQGKVCYINCKELSQKLDIKQQSIITILLKIQEMSEAKLIKVLAPSYEVLQVGFLKNNQKIVRLESQLYKKVVQESRTHNGKTFVRLIDVCNSMNRIPSDLLGELQSLADQYMMRIDKKKNVFVWKYIGQITFDEFNVLFGKQLVAEMKKIQDTRLLKLNTLYTMGYLNSYSSMDKLIEIEVKQKKHKYDMEGHLDKYFSSPSQQFYNQFTQGQHYLPIYGLQKSAIPTVHNLARRFLRHQGVQDKQGLQKYMNGKIVTNILLGISTPAFDEKKYGQQPYFGQFKNSEYNQVLVYAKEACSNYLEELQNDD